MCFESKSTKHNVRVLLMFGNFIVENKKNLISFGISHALKQKSIVNQTLAII